MSGPDPQADSKAARTAAMPLAATSPERRTVLVRSALDPTWRPGSVIIARRFCPEPGRAKRSFAGPDAGGLLESPQAPPVDQGLDAAGDGPLHRRRGEDLPPAAVRLRGLGGLLLPGDPLPDLLEQRSGHESADDAGQQAEGAVDQLHGRRSFPSGLSGVDYPCRRGPKPRPRRDNRA